MSDLINQSGLYESSSTPEECKDRLRTAPANTPETPIYVQFIGEGGGGGSLKCLNDVIDLLASIPLTITFPSISSICSVEFENTDGKRIYVGYEISSNSLIICSRQELNNIQYKVIGE